MYSQFGQDRYVLGLLGGQLGGFFLDSGAGDGVEASNTLLLEAAYGWTGVCVEPNARFFEQLRTRRRSLCINCCLHGSEGQVEFVESADWLGGIVETYDAALLEHVKQHYAQDGELATVSKPARTIASVLDACSAPHIIDYWSLDTEGSELAILQAFPFDRYAFRVLTVEHNWAATRAPIRRLLELHGYIHSAELGVDDCYVHPGLIGEQSSRSLAWRRGLRRA